VDFLNENVVVELGVDDLPEGCEDIRGRIHCQPARVFAVEESNIYGSGETGWTYIGIE